MARFHWGSTMWTCVAFVKVKLWKSSHLLASVPPERDFSILDATASSLDEYRVVVLGFCSVITKYAFILHLLWGRKRDRHHLFVQGLKVPVKNRLLSAGRLSAALNRRVDWFRIQCAALCLWG